MTLLQHPDPGSVHASVRAKAMVFEDPRSRELLGRIGRIAPSDAPVMIVGETGTGKELVARHVHEESARRARPFVAVNCGALPEGLIESELFGHERGAFTGALQTRPGWFEAADGGTLFLDEIGDLPLHVQVKLLRVLQEREVVRVGARKPIPIDVRLVVATHVDLETAVRERRFREDLYFRIHVATLVLPPLRERPGDILPLAKHFLSRYAKKLSAGEVVLRRDAEEKLLEHGWPGNIRELENVVHQALIIRRGDVVVADDLRLVSRATSSPRSLPRAAPDGQSMLEAALLAMYEENPPNLWDRLEETIHRTAFQYAERNQLAAARLLGISRNVVRARLARAGEIRVSPRQPTDRTSLAPSDARRRIRVGTQKLGILSLLKVLGRFEERLDALDLDVSWTEFPGGMQLVEAMEERRIDLGVVGEGPPVFAQSERAGLVYLAAEPEAPESEAIVVHRDSTIWRVSDLRGKTIAVNRGANADYLVARALEEAGLAREDVRISFVAPTGARAAFESREVDAWAIWNPHLASIEIATGARVLRDARGLAPNRTFYVGVRGFVDAREDVVTAFVDELSRVGAWVNDHVDEAAALISDEVGVARAAILATLRRARFGATPLDSALVASQQDVADRLHRTKLVPHPVRVVEATWSPRAIASSLATTSARPHHPHHE